MSLSRSKRVAVAVLCALTVTACASDGSPGVRTQSAQADIVFGVPAPEEAELATFAPPTEVQTDDGGDVQAAPPLRVPLRRPSPTRSPRVDFKVPAEEAPSCPTAPLGSAPPEVAARNAEAPPAAGLYRFKISGTRTRTINGSDIETRVQGFEPRIVQAVEEISETAWTFEIVQPNGDGSRITTYSVETKPTQQSVNPPYVAENPTRAGEPGRGVAIEKIEDFDSEGNPVGSFDPVAALLLMPLPVLPGEAFQSVATDTRGQSVQVDGEVLERQTVDACGELVDGWTVDHEVTDSRSFDSSVRHEVYVFATPMGGLPVSQRVVGETFDASSGNSTKFDITYSLGQVEPSPVPGGSQ